MSGCIRGPIGSIVTMTLRKRNGSQIQYCIPRARVPGAGTEMLGALFQSGTNPSQAKNREPTQQDKLAKLMALRRRGNLNEDEFNAAKQRLLSGQDSQLRKAPSAPSIGSMFSALGSGIYMYIYISATIDKRVFM